jgi:hypothetical protein
VIGDALVIQRCYLFLLGQLVLTFFPRMLSCCSRSCRLMGFFGGKAGGGAWTRGGCGRGVRAAVSRWLVGARGRAADAAVACGRRFRGG